MKNLRSILQNKLYLVFICSIILNTTTINAKFNSHLFFNVAVNHNLVFRNPKMSLDTIFNVNGKSYLFPAFGYEFGFGNQSALIDKYKLSLNYSIAYSRHTQKLRIDENTARYFTKYFKDPALETNSYYSTISILTYLHYQLRFVSVECGFIHSFLHRSKSTRYLLSGNKLYNKSKFGLELFSSFSFAVSCKINQNFEAVGALDMMKIPSIGSTFLRLGIKYYL